LWIIGFSTGSNGQVLTSDADGNATWQTPIYGSGWPQVCSWSWAWNTCYGFNSLLSNTTGENNTAYWAFGLTSNTVGSNNTAYWYYSLANNITWASNTANGFYSLWKNESGYYNTANGVYTLMYNTIGIKNTANGVFALMYNTEWLGNTANWVESLLYNTTGYFNTANGIDSLANNTVWSYNVALWASAGSNLISWDNNIAIGSTTDFLSSTGSNQLNIGNLIYGNNGNIGIWIADPSYKLDVAGTWSFYGLRIASWASLWYVLTSDADGNATWQAPTWWIDQVIRWLYNIGLWNGTLSFNILWSRNVAVWDSALFSNIYWSQNVAVWDNALLFNTLGSDNVGVWREALLNNIDGHDNIALGTNSSVSNIGWNGNVAMWNYALSSNTVGNYNTVNGTNAWYSSGGNSINGNSLFGYQAGYWLQTGGDYNTLIGFNAWSGLTTWSNNIVIWNDASSSSDTVANEVTLGNASNNSYRMYAWSWTNVSDRRLKHDIDTLTFGLDFVKKLSAKTFVYNNSTTGKKSIWFIAQDVASVLTDYSGSNTDLVTGFDETYLGVNYNYFIPILTKAVQELDDKVSLISGSWNIFTEILGRVTNLENTTLSNAITQTNMIHAVSDDVHVMKQQIAQIQSWTSVSNADIITINDKVTNARNDIQQLQDDITQIKTSQNTITTSTGLIDPIISDMALLKSRIDQFESTASGTMANTWLYLNTQFFDTMTDTVHSLVVKVQTTFNEYVTFAKSVIFSDTVTFEERVTFKDIDMAGRVTIPAWSTGVTVIFMNSYIEEPIIQLTAIWIPDGYFIGASSATGFTIEINHPETRDRKFNWTAIAVSGASIQTNTGAILSGVSTATSLNTQIESSTGTDNSVISSEWSWNIQSVVSGELLYSESGSTILTWSGM
jgi:hypothetical protein